MNARPGLAAALLLAALPTAAAADTSTAADAIVAAVEAKYADVTAMRASFVQTVRNPVFGDDVQEGNVVLARPSRMRWTFGADERQFVTDGSTMWIWSKADNQVIRYEGFTPSAGGAESLLTSLDRLDELFAVDVRESSAAGTRLTLTPREEGQVKGVELSLTADLLVDEVVITDAFDQVTELDFSAVELNVAAPPALFTFAIPAGAELIEAGSL